MKKLLLALAVLLLLTRAAHFLGLFAWVARRVRLLDPLFQQGEERIGTMPSITVSGTRRSPRFEAEVAELKPDWLRFLEQFTGRQPGFRSVTGCPARALFGGEAPQ